MINSINIVDAWWSGITYESSIGCNIGENQIQVTGSSIYLEFETNGNIKTKSCEYPIIKTPLPTFTLSPTSLSIPCGDTGSRTFTVASANIPNGSTLTYNWSYPGWSGTSSNTNTITLTPSSGTNLPSTVLVTPVLNGVSKPAMTCTISRATFSSSAAVTGPTDICTGSAVYAISNITAGQTVTWVLSNPSIGSITSQSNTGATVAFSGNGAQTLRASITNQCGEIVYKPFIINTGAATFVSAATVSGNASFCSGSNTYTISGVLAGQTVAWELSDPTIANLSGSTNTQTTVNFTGSGAQTLSAVITNSCGQTDTKPFQIYGGVPTLSSFTCGAGATFCDGTVCICDSCLPAFDASSLLNANMSGQTSAEFTSTANWQWAKLNNNIQITTNRGTKCYIAGNVLGSTGVQVRAKNSCGWSQWYTLNFDVVSCNKMLSVNPNVYAVYPNPSKDSVNIELLNKSYSDLNTSISGELFDLLGISKSKVEIKDNKAVFSVKGLTKGIYILKIFINDKVETHQIAVE